MRRGAPSFMKWAASEGVETECNTFEERRTLWGAWIAHRVCVCVLTYVDGDSASPHRNRKLATSVRVIMPSIRCVPGCTHTRRMTPGSASVSIAVRSVSARVHV